MEETLTQIKEILIVYGIRVIAALAIFIIGRWIAKGIRNLIRRIMTRSKVDQTLISFVCNLQNKLIVFADDYFGNFPSHEVFMLVDVPIRDTEKELNITRGQVYAKYTEPLGDKKF